MKRIVFVLTILVALTSLASAQTAPSATARPAGSGAAFVDANGDGICDNFQAGTNAGRGQRAGGGYGPGNGTGNAGVGPRNGSGYGPGTGICTNTGTAGQMRRQGRR